MKRIGFAALAGVLAGSVAQAADLSRYTSVNDKKACAYAHSKAGDDGPESCEFSCKGPVAGVSTKLLSCSDYEHLFVKLDGRSYSTWQAMTAVGGFSGLANKNGMVEWVFAGGAAPSRGSLKGLIVRFQGADAGSGKSRNALTVIALTPGEPCWKGNYPTNEAARAALDEARCQSPLAEEGR
ncbi:MAG: hypothetical protein QM651_10740 [Rhodoblastus sp.]